jgi:hypothetical protein
MMTMIIDVVYFLVMIVYLMCLDSGCKHYSCIINITKILKVSIYFSRYFRCVSQTPYSLAWLGVRPFLSGKYC